MTRRDRDALCTLVWAWRFLSTSLFFSSLVVSLTLNLSKRVISFFVCFYHLRLCCVYGPQGVEDIAVLHGREYPFIGFHVTLFNSTTTSPLATP